MLDISPVIPASCPVLRAVIKLLKDKFEGVPSLWEEKLEPNPPRVSYVHSKEASKLRLDYILDQTVVNVRRSSLGIQCISLYRPLHTGQAELLALATSCTEALASMKTLNIELSLTEIVKFSDRLFLGEYAQLVDILNSLTALPYYAPLSPAPVVAAWIKAARLDARLSTKEMVYKFMCEQIAKLASISEL